MLCLKISGRYKQCRGGAPTQTTAPNGLEAMASPPSSKNKYEYMERESLGWLRVSAASDVLPLWQKCVFFAPNNDFG